MLIRRVSPGQLSIEIFLPHHGEAILSDSMLSAVSKSYFRRGLTLRRLIWTKEYENVYGSEVAKAIANIYGAAILEDLFQFQQK